MNVTTPLSADLRKIYELCRYIVIILASSELFEEHVFPIDTLSLLSFITPSPLKDVIEIIINELPRLFKAPASHTARNYVKEGPIHENRHKNSLLVIKLLLQDAIFHIGSEIRKEPSIVPHLSLRRFSDTADTMKNTMKEMWRDHLLNNRLGVVIIEGEGADETKVTELTEQNLKLWSSDINDANEKFEPLSTDQCYGYLYLKQYGEKSRDARSGWCRNVSPIDLQGLFAKLAHRVRDDHEIIREFPDLNLLDIQHEVNTKDERYLWPMKSQDLGDLCIFSLVKRKIINKAWEYQID